MNLEEFREGYINDINAEAVNSSRYEVEVFIDSTIDILANDYNLVSEMSQCFYEYNRVGGGKYRSMHIDAAFLDLPSNTLNMLYADYEMGIMSSITNTLIQNKAQSLLNFFDNSLKGYFASAEQSDPAVQLGQDVRRLADSIYSVQLFIVSTNKLSGAVKKLDLDDYTFNGRTYKVSLNVLDIEGIFRSKQASFQKEDIVIKCSEFGIKGIPCIKAEIETDQYVSYLAIVPGSFLADIYKKYSSSLLESNVRSYLKMNGGVNKGIRGTILNEKSRFFTYNNGISTTAKSIVTDQTDGGLYITEFTDLQIINGGQTTATLAATSIKNNADLSGIYVQMKLTVLRDADPDLIRNIAKYANSQNRVKTADLNSSHPFYVKIEEFSRKLYAPLASGSLVQQLWFFERARGQYDQPTMQMTKKQRDDYKLVRPKSKRFTLTDLAKYINAAECLPHYVSWGGEVNADQFHANMVKQWEKDKSIFNELFYKELIGKKILYGFIENTISNQDWYIERRAYRPQLVAYTFSKFVYEAQKLNRYINYRKIWDLQSVPQAFEKDIALIGKIVFDCIYDDSRSTANIETYCKKEECWKTVQKREYSISAETLDVLVDYASKQIENVSAKKEQKFINGISDEISIFQKGARYWEMLIERGRSQEVLNYADIEMLKAAVNYCNGKYLQLSRYQLKEIQRIVQILKDNMIE